MRGRGQGMGNFSGRGQGQGMGNFSGRGQGKGMGRCTGGGMNCQGGLRDGSGRQCGGKRRRVNDPNHVCRFGNEMSNAQQVKAQEAKEASESVE